MEKKINFFVGVILIYFIKIMVFNILINVSRETQDTECITERPVRSEQALLFMDWGVK